MREVRGTVGAGRVRAATVRKSYSVRPLGGPETGMRYALWVRGILMLTAVQFLLGIWVSLYGALPTTGNVARVVEYSGDPALSAHLALAVVLVLVAFVLAVGAFSRSAPPRLRWPALGGLLSLLVAYEAGFEFLLSRFQDNDYSFVMAVGFIAAIAFYGIAQGLVLDDTRSTAQERDAPPAGGPDPPPAP